MSSVCKIPNPNTGIFNSGIYIDHENVNGNSVLIHTQRLDDPEQPHFVMLKSTTWVRSLDRGRACSADVSIGSA